tara:strand:- start:1396 stop:1947 length:552 start_codon:yes stop_codon:yes gene_type:complete
MSDYDMYTIIKQVNYVKKHYNFDYNKETKPVLDKNTSVEIYPKIGDRLYRINKKEIKDNKISQRNDVKKKIYNSGLKFVELDFVPAVRSVDYDNRHSDPPKKKRKINNLMAIKKTKGFRTNDKVKIICSSENIINGKAKLQYDKGSKFRYGVVTKISNKSPWLNIKCVDGIIPIRPSFLEKIS